MQNKVRPRTSMEANVLKMEPKYFGHIERARRFVEIFSEDNSGTKKRWNKEKKEITKVAISRISRTNNRRPEKQHNSQQGVEGSHHRVGDEFTKHISLVFEPFSTICS